MAQVLIRDLDKKTVLRLKERARQHGRSLQAELKVILEREARIDVAGAKVLALRIQKRLAVRQHSDSATLVAEDRGR